MSFFADVTGGQPQLKTTNMAKEIHMRAAVNIHSDHSDCYRKHYSTDLFQCLSMQQKSMAIAADLIAEPITQPGLLQSRVAKCRTSSCS